MRLSRQVQAAPPKAHLAERELFCTARGGIARFAAAHLDFKMAPGGDSRPKGSRLRIRFPFHAARRRPVLAFAAVLALSACGPPDHPREEPKTGDLGRAMAEAKDQPWLAKPVGVTGASAVFAPGSTNAGPVYVTIRFDREKVTYDDTLYSALSRAIERYPAAAFDVVLAMPPLAANADAEEATARGERRVEDVVLLMTDIGVPADRVRIAATTDTEARYDEIRIYVH